MCARRVPPGSRRAATKRCSASWSARIRPRSASSRRRRRSTTPSAGPTARWASRRSSPRPRPRLSSACVRASRIACRTSSRAPPTGSVWLAPRHRPPSAQLTKPARAEASRTALAPSSRTCSSWARPAYRLWLAGVLLVASRVEACGSRIRRDLWQVREHASAHPPVCQTRIASTGWTSIEPPLEVTAIEVEGGAVARDARRLVRGARGARGRGRVEHGRSVRRRAMP